MDEYNKSLKRHEIQEGHVQKSAQEKLKKLKTTIYLTEEAERAFTEIYIHRLRKNRKIDRSMIACDAILALYEKECAQNIM